MVEYVEKEGLLKALVTSDEIENLFQAGVAAARAVVASAPAADVISVIYSQWEECDYVEPDGHGFGTIRIPNAGLKCIHCNHVFKKELLWANNYCPSCGAKMKGENNAID